MSATGSADAGAALSPTQTNAANQNYGVLMRTNRERSEWKFRAASGLYGFSAFDGPDTFDLPRFQVEVAWPRYEPLTFEIYVPYFLEAAVSDLEKQYRYPGKLLVFKGLPLERIQEVVNQTKAAGVRGSVHFTLYFFEPHLQQDLCRLDGQFLLTEDAGARDALTAGSVGQSAEDHAVSDRLGLGGVFDFATFDGDFVFT